MASAKLTNQIRRQIASNNPLETGGTSVGDFPRELGRQLKQTLQSTPDDFVSQLLGRGRYENTASHQGSMSQEMRPGEEFILPKKQASKELSNIEHKPHVAAGIEYHANIVHNSERISKKENREIQYQIQQVMEELQRLVASSDKIVQMAYGEVTVASAPKAVGKYHTNFFSWMLSVIRTARQQVEDSGAWLAVAKSKGHGRGYKNMAKSHGTSFTQSNERNVATQSG